MKISDEEVQAALKAYYGTPKLAHLEENMRAALKAAYAVRKSRKAKKRAKAKPSILDEDQQEALRQAEQPVRRFKVGDRVVHAGSGAGVVLRADDSALPYLVDFDTGRRHWCRDDSLLPAPAAPAWNGKFEVGKSYRTRNGRKATVSEIRVGGRWPIVGRVPGLAYPLLWWEDGGLDVHRTEHHLDLIGPWEGDK